MAGGRPPTITREKVEPLISEFFGCYARIADALKVTRQAVGHFFQKHPDLAELAEAEEERINDLVINSLAYKAMHGDLGAQIFWLRSKAKHRGFSSNKQQPLEQFLEQLPKQLAEALRKGLAEELYGNGTPPSDPSTGSNAGGV